MTIAIGRAMRVACLAVAISPHSGAKAQPVVDSLQQLAAHVLRSIPWATVCYAPHKCPIVVVDTSLYITETIAHAPNESTARATFDQSRIIASNSKTRTFVPGTRSDHSVPTRDTATVSLFVVMARRGRGEVRRVEAEMVLPQHPFGARTVCYVHWSRARWRIWKIVSIDG